MNFNQLLQDKGIDPRTVIVMRHRPSEPKLAKAIGWLAQERHDYFNAYQQTQGPKVERAMSELSGRGYIASFIHHGGGKALFVGIYKIGGTTPMTEKKYWDKPAHLFLKQFGMEGFRPENRDATVLWFDLQLTEHFADWKGKLIVKWPPPDISWYRRAEKNVIKVLAITEENALEQKMPAWDEINLTWGELAVLPSKWKVALAEWRGVYYIFDELDGKGYVGSAYGNQNIQGRWSQYAATGHGDVKLLRQRDPKSFRFSILQRVSPDMVSEEVIRLEASWKDRLHTRQPFGLNSN